MSYIDRARAALEAELPDQPAELLDLYLLLVLVDKDGAQTTQEDVHHAWAIWRSRNDPDHRSIVPFNHLSREVQELDEPYVQAIIRARASAGWPDGAA